MNTAALNATTLTSMPEVPLTPAPARRAMSAEKLLRASGVLWLMVAVLSQSLMAVYVAIFYGSAALRGRPQDWNDVLAYGYRPGELALNAVLAMHLLFVVVIIASGAAQLIPAIRRRVPQLHRWNGYLYLVAAAAMALGGLALVWLRGAVGDLSQHLAISVNALLILLFAGLAWRTARRRDFTAHRRWALRLFLAVGGVWFFRLGLTLWLAINRGPVGFDMHTFSGPFLTALNIAQFAVPLAVLQLYLRVQAGGTTRTRGLMAATMFGLSLMTIAGTATAAMMLWLPRL